MRSSHASNSNAKASSAESVAFIVCIVVLVAGMVVFWYYPYPSGRETDLFNFVAFWLRELLILATVLVVAVYFVIASLLKRGRRS